MCIDERGDRLYTAKKFPYVFVNNNFLKSQFSLVLIKHRV